MKKIWLCLVLLVLIPGVRAQDKGTPPPAELRRFHVGINYSYSQVSYKLFSYTAHSVWQGADLGTVTLTGNEIDTINAHRKDKNDVNALLLQFGAVILKTSDGHWFLDGTLSLGISSVKTQTNLDVPRQNLMEVKSGLQNPTAGIAFNLRYNFTNHWGVTMLPEMNFLWGHSEKITDSIHPMVAHFSNELRENYSFIYARNTLMASYTYKGFTVSAGPGFYFSHTWKTYTIQRTNPENGNFYYDEIKTSLNSKYFVDACLRADWCFIDPLAVSIQAAVGKDIYIAGGLRFNF